MRAQRGLQGKFPTQPGVTPLDMGGLAPQIKSPMLSPDRRVSPRRLSPKKKTGCLCWKKSSGPFQGPGSPRRRPKPARPSSLLDLNKMTRQQPTLAERKKSKDKYRLTVTNIIKEGTTGGIKNFGQITGNLEGDTKKDLEKTFLQIEFIRRSTGIARKLFTLVYILNVGTLCI
jgi:translation initiation factor 2 beta subunit (eIF-2beta)/eIF-5